MPRKQQSSIARDEYTQPSSHLSSSCQGKVWGFSTATRRVPLSIHRVCHSDGQSGAPPAESGQVDGLVVGHAVFPAAERDANPFECERANCSVMIVSSCDLLLVVSPSPNRVGDRVGCPLMKRLA